MKKELLLRLIKNTGLVALGTLILAFATAVFILPFDLVIGGMSGLAIGIDRLCPWECVSEDLLITLLCWGLFLLGFLILGKRFAAKTLVSALLYPIGIAVFSRLADADILNGFFHLPAGEHPQAAMLLGALFGGLLIGVGCALTFLGGGSSGGTDIIAFSLCKYFKKWRSSYVIFAVDASIILFGMFAVADLTRSLLGILSAFLCALAVDRLFLGGNRALSAQIISDRYEEINQAIITHLQRTTTLLSAKGGYSGADKTMLQVSFSLRQYALLRMIIEQYDPDAFVTVLKVHEINGQGWR